MSEVAARQWGIAWIALSLAFGVHVADEALTGFLPFYNATVGRVREIVPWLPLPTFTFPIWLGGLVTLVLVLLLLSPLVFRGRAWLRPPSYFLAVLMIANALGHTAASIFLGRWVPGTYSSPALLVAGIALLVTALRSRPTRVYGVRRGRDE